MLELARIETQNTVSGRVWPGAGADGLVLGLARTNEELEAIQRLRYTVFTDEMNAVFPSSADGLDSDRFDPWCEHLMVRDLRTGVVVGTYRILTPSNAIKAGGYYSESEFDLTALGDKRNSIVEVGRSCTHPDYRNGSVIMLLWSGIAKFVENAGYRHVLGCASVSLRDDGVTAAEVWRVANREMAKYPDIPRLTPWHRYPVERLDSELPARMPPLIKGYMKLGAKICGDPAWDPDFNTADFPVMLDVTAMDIRYKRHFGIED